MGKRMRNGGERLPSARFSKTRLLRQRIVESGLDASLDAELVASSLRKRYRREYGRVKLQPFSHQVSQVLASLRHPPTTAATSHDITSSASDDSSSPAIKHARPRCHPSLSSSESHVQSDGSQSTSTSEGDSPDPKPAIDVTKLFLRDGLLKNNAPKQSLKRTREHNMEIDVAMEKPKVGEGGANEGYSGNSWGQEGKVGPRFVDLGGMEGVIEELMNDVITPFCQPELLRFLGVTPISGLLLHGPPGCGKTTLAHAIANETGVSFYNISAPEVVSGVSGKSEENIRNLFNKAYRTAPSIVFIDEIDAIASKRENLQREMERGIVTQLMTCMDQFHQVLRNQKPDPSQDKPPGHVLVIGATNRPDAVDQALRRPGRFDREIALGVPCESARAEILSMLTQRMRLEGKFDLFKIARSTPGFVGADLKALVDKAGNLAIRRINDKRKSSLNLEDWRRRPWDEAEMESLSITMADFEDAVKMIQPCLRREGFSSIPNVTWDDVGGLTSIREVFEWDIVYQIKHPQVHEELGINLEGGFLLFGPPGCCKTLIAKAVANESGANFIHIKGPELLSKYVGESESEVRKIFARARTNSPCIIFFDEVDALTASGKEGGGVVDRVLKQLLVELHGGEPRQGVYVIGATNRIEEMDPALLRPGRFEKILHVPIPGPDERVAIMKAYARKKPIDADVDLDSFARSERCNNLTGADLAKLMREAAKIALRERLGNETSISDKPTVKASHFEQALSQITISTTAEQRRHYALQSRLYT